MESGPPGDCAQAEQSTTALPVTVIRLPCPPSSISSLRRPPHPFISIFFPPPCWPHRTPPLPWTHSLSLPALPVFPCCTVSLLHCSPSLFNIYPSPTNCCTLPTCLAACHLSPRALFDFDTIAWTRTILLASSPRPVPLLSSPSSRTSPLRSSSTPLSAEILTALVLLLDPPNGRSPFFLPPRSHRRSSRIRPALTRLLQPLPPRWPPPFHLPHRPRPGPAGVFRSTPSTRRRSSRCCTCAPSERCA